MTNYLMLVINPGNLSTKLALFLDDRQIHEQNIKHTVDDLLPFHDINDQLDFRKQLILDFLTTSKYSLDQIDVFIGRGGLVRSLPEGGTYLITPKMIEDLRNAINGKHASNLGAMLAYDLAKPYNRPSYICNPVSVDEMHDLARISGFKGMERKSFFHVLNQKAISIRHAKSIGRDYKDLNLIVCHMGSGISIGYHKHGRVLDVNNALGGDGPFSPERANTLPLFQVVDLCFSGKYSDKETLKKQLVSQGGLTSYLGTGDCQAIAKRIDAGDLEAKKYFEAMAYQIAKAIGSLYFIAHGEIDAILLTGGIAYNKMIVDMIRSYVDPIKPLVVYPGEDEMRALAEGVFRVLTHQDKSLVY